MGITGLEPAVRPTEWRQIQTLRFFSFLEIVPLGSPNTVAIQVCKFQQTVCTASVVCTRFDGPDGVLLVDTGPAVHVDVTGDECLFLALVGCMSELSDDRRSGNLPS
jgi:hypothetical protein